MGRRRRQPGGQSLTAVRLALLGTVLLLAAFAVGGSARALLAFAWVLLMFTAFGFEWSARRRSRQAATAAAPAAKAPRGAPGARAPRARRGGR
jgi:hypothetical protein